MRAWARAAQKESPKPSIRRNDSSEFCGGGLRWIERRIATRGECGDDDVVVVNEVVVGGRLYTVSRANEREIVPLMMGSCVSGSTPRVERHDVTCDLMSCARR